MKNKQKQLKQTTTVQDQKSNDRIRVGVRVRPPLLKEFHDEKAFFDFDSVRINSN